jgi:hypothetical protein
VSTRHDTLIDVVSALEREMSDELGGFSLFALFLRADAPGRWDLVIAAAWITDREAAVKDVVERLKRSGRIDSLTELSRIVVVNPDDPGVNALQRAFDVEHGRVQISNSSFFGVDINNAFLITSRRPEAAAVRDTGGPRSIE